MLNEQQTIIADPTAILRDLEFFTARWPELGQRLWLEIRAFKEDANPQVAKFRPEPDWIAEAVAWIVDMNARGFNIYAVRNPVKDSVKGSASDTDIAAAFFLWADCDDQAATDNVRRFDGPKWTASVVTGRTPTPRAHTYWSLKEPCTDLDAWRAMQTQIAAHFASDRAVINPSRIMRVGGTVSHPDSRKQARGYTCELTTITTEYTDTRAPVTLEQMARVFGSSTPAAQPQSARFEIDAGFAPPLDRERLAIQAMSGMEWHNAVIRLVASYVGKGLSDGEIHALTDPLTLPGYTVDQTRREVQTAIDGARRKGWTPDAQYASPAAIVPAATPVAPPDATGFDTPKRPHDLEWFDTIQPATTAPYIVKGVIDEGAMAVIYGPSNSGKTFWTMDLAFHIAIGAAWRGRRVRQASVLYLAAEGGRGVLNRVAALRQENGVLDVPMAIKRAGLDLLHDNADLQHLVDLSAEVRAVLPEAPHIIVIDTLSRIMAGGDENNAADMTALIRNIDAVREATGAHVILVHHTGKDTARGARGHSSLRAATDTEIEVANENGARAAMVTKQRDNPGGEVFPFTLKSVSLGHDQDGDEVTSCTVEAQDEGDYQAAVAQKKGLGGNQKILADTFDQMVSEGVARPNPGGVGMPETGRFWSVTMDEFRTHCMGKMAATNKRGAFSEAWKALTDGRGLFCAASDLVWRTDRKVNQ